MAWRPPSHRPTAVLAPPRRASKEAAEEEYRRLLYVGMTRAEDRPDRLRLARIETPEKDCWYDLIAGGLEGILTETEADGGRKLWQLKNEPTVLGETSSAKSAEVAAASLPDWAIKPAPPERRPPQLLPSRIGLRAGGGAPGTIEQPPLGPRALGDNKRFSRGRIVHTLLQYLPSVDAADREQAARAFVAVRGAELDPAVRVEIVAESLAIIGDPGFSPLFGPGSLGEVPLVARLGDGENAVELSGQIDRLAILDDGLLILDYKTNRPPPSEPDRVAPGYIAQLAAYRLALRGMFPNLPLRAAIVWTDGPKMMEIPSTLLDTAERRILSAERQP